MARHTGTSRTGSSSSRHPSRPQHAQGTLPQPRQTTSRCHDAFHLPAGVSSTKEHLPYSVAYMFRHRELGMLGRIVLQGMEGGYCHVSWEVAGDPEDPMTARRLEVFDPVAKNLVQRLAARTGGVDRELRVELPSRPPEAGELVESKLIQCARCDAGVALLIFADRAREQGGLEDYARKMYRQVVRLNLPTYVIGPPIGPEPLPERPADILEIWPGREPLKRLRPDEFHPIMAELAHAHCD